MPVRIHEHAVLPALQIFDTPEPGGGSRSHGAKPCMAMPAPETHITASRNLFHEITVSYVIFAQLLYRKLTVLFHASKSSAGGCSVVRSSGVMNWWIQNRLT